MTDLKKHRLEAENYFVSFEKRLESGESLTGSPDVLIARWDGSAWVDVTSEFGDLSAAVATQDISGSSHRGVAFTLNAATGSDQSEGTYEVRVKVDADSGRTLVARVKKSGTHDLILPQLSVVDDPATL